MFEWPLFRVLWCSASKSGGREREKSIKAVDNKNKKKRKKGKKKKTGWDIFTFPYVSSECDSL